MHQQRNWPSGHAVRAALYQAATDGIHDADRDAGDRLATIGCGAGAITAGGNHEEVGVQVLEQQRCISKNTRRGVDNIL